MACGFRFWCMPLVGMVISVMVALMRTKDPYGHSSVRSPGNLCTAAVNLLGTFTGVSLGLNLFSELAAQFSEYPSHLFAYYENTF